MYRNIGLKALRSSTSVMWKAGMASNGKREDVKERPSIYVGYRPG
jgi:hypothetical protein